MKSYQQKACQRIIRKAENEILNVSINNSSSSSSSSSPPSPAATEASEKCNKKENTHSYANKSFQIKLEIN